MMSNLKKDTHDHQYWMSKAIQLAKKGLFTTRENPRVGCVIVKNNQLLGEGFHAYAGEVHAEINAINSMAFNNVADSSVYVTLEPCAHIGKTPPCVDALIKAKPKQVVIAMQDPNPLVAGKSVAKLKQHGIDVIEGVLEAEAFALNKGFIKRMSCDLPYLRLKMAMSLDGKTALKNGQSQWITGAEARQDVQKLRAQSCAILTGINTVIADDPSLNVRLNTDGFDLKRPIQQPVKVVLDSSLKMPLDAKMLALEGAIWVFTTTANAEKAKQLEDAGCVVYQLSDNERRLDLTQVLQVLAQQGINEVHTECGAQLAGSLLKAQLVDEMVVYLAPKLMGAQSRSLLDFGELTQMDQAIDVTIQKISTIGQDMKLQLKPLYS